MRKRGDERRWLPKGKGKPALRRPIQPWAFPVGKPYTMLEWRLRLGKSFARRDLLLPRLQIRLRTLRFYSQAVAW